MSDKAELTLFTFGDSILDSGRYNQYGINVGELLVRNDDRLFPEFRGRDLSSLRETRLEDRAVDGATVGSLPRQAAGLQVRGQAVGILTIGGNDLLAGLVQDTGPGVERFRQALTSFVRALPVRPLFIGNVYDPTFGDDSRNFLGIDPRIARRNHGRVNQVIAEVASEYGALVDLYAHFMTGDPSWYTSTIEPSLQGVSEVRRVFLTAIEKWLQAS